MSNKLFTKEEVKILSENKYVKIISTKGITYTNEFKNIFMIENEQGKFPRQIFYECGFDIDIIGIKRIKSAGNRWRTSYNRNGVAVLTDARKSNSGRPSEKEEIRLSSEQKFIILKLIIEKYKLKNMVTHLCKVSGASRSGYYNYFTDKSKTYRDTLDKANELVIYNFQKA